MITPAPAMTSAELAVLDASTRSLMLIHDIETALFLCRLGPTETDITSRAPMVEVQCEILAMLHGPDWASRPEAVALLT